MSFLSRLFGGGGSAAPAGADGTLWLYVRCARCGEAIRVRINPRTDAQPEYDESGRSTHHFLRKEILGNNCPNLMSVELQLDSRYRTTDQTAERCAIITQEEYEEARRVQGQ